MTSGWGEELGGSGVALIQAKPRGFRTLQGVSAVRRRRWRGSATSRPRCIDGIAVVTHGPRRREQLHSAGGAKPQTLRYTPKILVAGEA